MSILDLIFNEGAAAVHYLKSFRRSRISLVTTLYQSASCLEEFYARARRAASALTDDFELIFVNDGSPDNSLEIALILLDKDPRVSVIDLHATSAIIGQ